MTEYLKKSFSVPLGGKAYGDGWDRIFGKKEPEEAAPAASPEADGKEKEGGGRRQSDEGHDGYDG